MAPEPVLDTSRAISDGLWGHWAVYAVLNNIGAIVISSINHSVGIDAILVVPVTAPRESTVTSTLLASEELW